MPLFVAMIEIPIMGSGLIEWATQLRVLNGSRTDAVYATGLIWPRSVQDRGWSVTLMHH